MKKAFTILAGLALLCSCEKIESFYIYEDVVPGTTIKENQLREVSYQQFVEATEGAYYNHRGSYPCKKLGNKVYYSNEIDNTPIYTGSWSVNVIKFQPTHVEDYWWLFPDIDSSTLSYIDYEYEGNVLSGINLREIVDCKENRVLYVDDEFLIFEVDGKTKNRYNNEGSEFSRVVYGKTIFPQIPEDVPEIKDTIDCRKG